MKKIKTIIKQYKMLIYCFVVAIGVLLFTSKNSFFYPFNDWVDANAFFTVGKGIFRGVIPYLDVFEQKGLLLYLLYGIGSLISYNSFHGVFIVEVILFSIFLYYIGKIVSLLFCDKVNYIVLPLFSLLVCTSPFFVHGGSAEEICFPFIAVSLYYFVRHFEKKEMSYKEIVLNGVMAGCVFMIKYTVTGFWIGFILFLFIDYLLRRDFKKAFLGGIYFILGMVIPIVLSCIYLASVGALKEFINDYFIINLTLYGDTELELGERIEQLYQGIINVIVNNNGILISSLILLLPYLFTKIKTKVKVKWYLFGIFIFSSLGIFYGLKFYLYYGLPLLIFLMFSLLGIFTMFNKYLNYLIKFKYYKIIVVIVFSLCLLGSYLFCNYREMLFTSKDDYFQYRYAEYINKYENATLLNMGYLDAGLYTTSGILPSTKYFEVQNLSYDKYPDNIDSMKEVVINREVMFVLYYTRGSLEQVKNDVSYLFENYDLIFDDSQEFEHKTYNAYLFKVKGN